MKMPIDPCPSFMVYSARITCSWRWRNKPIRRQGMCNHGYRKIGSCSVVALAMTFFSVPAKATLMVNIGGMIQGGVVTGGDTYTDNGPQDANSDIGLIDLGVFLN